MEKLEKQRKIAALIAKIDSCKRCSLAKTKTRSVPGEGDIDSEVMFIGEAPGANEDLQGKPFVGRAGDIFTRLLGEIGLTREQIYLCNILKCRPPDNRNPLPGEIAACQGSLDLQIKIIAPSIICTLGKFSTEYIFNKYGLPLEKISSLHGKLYKASTENGEKTILPLFHPAVAVYDINKYGVLKKDIEILGKLLT
ncbi:MAG: uracil-DNA glycosylase [Candidatus Omnitrophica bacterium]|nr:uracil-DNA glycosylase [Candidatus Omnitrophota bacterium]